jgi:hypothetical protein
MPVHSPTCLSSWSAAATPKAFGGRRFGNGVGVRPGVAYLRVAPNLKAMSRRQPSERHSAEHDNRAPGTNNSSRKDGGDGLYVLHRPYRDVKYFICEIRGKLFNHSPDQFKTAN